MANLADNTAATNAGWRRIQIDRGASVNPRYQTRYEKWVTGATNEGGALLKADGVSNVDQATADSQALAALNGQRLHRYGSSSGLNKNPVGNAHTADAT